MNMSPPLTENPSFKCKLAEEETSLKVRVKRFFNMGNTAYLGLLTIKPVNRLCALNTGHVHALARDILT